VIRWSVSRYLRRDDGDPSPSPHRKWMSDRMESTYSLQSKILLTAAIPGGGAGVDEDDDEITEQRSAGATIPSSLAEPTTPRSPDATRA
jgi:hypothetical protein